MKSCLSAQVREMSYVGASSRAMHVGLFTECDDSIVNGVVASVRVLRDGLARIGCAVTTVAPELRACATTDSRSRVRVPSLPLPTSTAYRLCLPYIRARDRAAYDTIDIAHAHSPFVTGWMAAIFARRRGLPLVFTYHTRIDEYAHYAPFEPRITRAAMIALTRTYANACDVTIVPTQPMEVRLREIGVTGAIAIVPTAIDVAQFAQAIPSRDVRARMSQRPDARIALLVARLGREKNVALAIDALAYAPGVHLAVVGDGPLRAELRERARHAGVDDRVRFVGALAPAAMPEVYASADAFVFSSATETQGLVLAEALAARLPIVAVASDVTRDVLGGHGRLVAANAPALGAALAAVAHAPRSPAGAIDAAARFGRELQTRRTVAVYRDALAARIVK